MGFFKKVMASVGIGAARVDSRLDNPEVRVGDTLSGIILVNGGKAEQEIRRISLGLNVRYKGEEEYEYHTLFMQEVVHSFTIQANEVKEFPFQLPIPAETPLSLPGSEITLITDADIAGGVDPSDHDPVIIMPSEEMEVIITASEQLGFHLKTSEIEYHHGHLVQELSFNPPYGQYDLSELEMMILPSHGGLDVILEVDRRARGIASLFTDEFETKGRWFISEDFISQGPNAVARDMEERIRDLS